MTGNVWEWTSDWFTLHPDDLESQCCVPETRASPRRSSAPRRRSRGA